MPRGSYPGGAHRRTANRAARVRSRRAFSLLFMTLVLPGSAQLMAGSRWVGRIAVNIYLLLVVVGIGALVGAVFSRRFAIWMVANPDLLLGIRIGLIALAVGWALLFMDTWRISQPGSLSVFPRLTLTGLNGLLCLTVAGVLLYSAHLVTVQRDVIVTIFGNSDTVTEATGGRYNVLLLGGDSGDGRFGIRTDSITVASIDADTGKTTLFGVPRNLEKFKFAPGSVLDHEYPDGYDCEGCYINGVGTLALDRPDLFPDTETATTDATIMAVEGVLGLKINYWVEVDLQGFTDLVDAVGGVELTIRDRIPVGGLGDDVTGYLEPGTRRLNGEDTLWFARAREGSDDYSRMARQKCVMSAMLNQISPQTMVTHFEDIANATTGLVTTNMPSSELDTFVDLALKAKEQNIATVSFVPPMIDTADPDLELIRSRVIAAIGPPADQSTGPSETASASPGKPKKSKSPDTSEGGSLGSRDDGYVANDTEDLGAAC